MTVSVCSGVQRAERLWDGGSQEPRAWKVGASQQSKGVPAGVLEWGIGQCPG